MNTPYERWYLLKRKRARVARLTPIVYPTPSGDRTVVMSSRKTLPDGAYPVVAGKGYPCTGAAADSNGTYWCSHGSASALDTAGFLNLSADLTTVLAQYTSAQLGLPAGSAQGIGVDGNTIWYILKATSTGAKLVHATKSGQLLNSIALTDATWNGLTVDTKRNCLIMIKDNGAVTWITKPLDTATTVSGTGKTGFTAAGSDNDMLFYDAARDELLISGGPNDAAANTVDVYNCETITRISTLTLDNARAIEGIVRVGNNLLAWNDQYTHPVSSSPTNQVQTYTNAFVVTPTAPTYAFAASSYALEGDTATFTLNVVRNNTLGALSGTWTVSGITADSADFVSTTGSWTIPAGSSSTTISVTSSEDTDVEGDQTYTLSASVSNVIVASATGTIGEDDAPVAGEYSAEATSLFARMTTQPATARKNAINNLIVSLKSSGVWNLLDWFAVHAAHDAQAATLDWVQNRAITLSGTSPIFTADRGYATINLNLAQFFHLGFTPTTAVKFVRDNASMLYWSNKQAANGTAGAATFATLDTATNTISLNTRTSTDLIAGTANSTTVSVGSAITDGRGLSGWSRTGSTTGSFYKNGASAGAITTTSTALPSANFSVGRRGSSNAENVQCALTLIGGALTPEQHASVYTAVSQYMAAVGNV